MQAKAGTAQPSLAMALLPLAATMAILVYHIFVNRGAPHVPLVIGIFLTALLGLRQGLRWADLQDSIVANVSLSIPVLGIMLAVGMTIGTWILCGTVPLLTKVGLATVSGSAFLPVVCIACAIVSLFTGTSWGTVGTVGLALLGIGEGLGVPAYLTAGAVVSGAWFGDKMSPLSDTTNFAAAIVGADLYAHIRNMLPSTIPAMLIALLLYAFIGSRLAAAEPGGQELQQLIGRLDEHFVLNALVLVPPAVIAVTIVRRIPALPGIFLGVVAAGLVAIVVQGASPGDVLEVMMVGYVSDTGIARIDALLSKGGILSMMWVVSLIMIAMAFGGMLQRTGCLDVIVATLLRNVRRPAGLITVALASAAGFNLCSNAFVAYTVPGRMFAPAFRGHGLSTTNLSRVLEDGATMSAPLIPWNSGAVYVSGTLGIPTLLYAPFAFANWIAPLFDILWAWTGRFLPAATDAERRQWESRGEEIVAVRSAG